MEKASNNQIKLLRKLGQRKYREQEGLFLVEGERAVEQVLENRLLKVRNVFVSSGRIGNHSVAWDQCNLIDEEEFTELADTENTQGILALCEMPTECEIDSLLDKEGVIIATDRIQDPGNMGTILRTAAWFGAQALVVGKGSVDVFNPKVVRSTAGATGAMPYLTGEMGELLNELESSGWEILLLDGNPGAIPIARHKSRTKTVIIVGNEANGIHPDLFTEKRKRVRITSGADQPYVESLNAAIAVAIALFTIHS